MCAPFHLHCCTVCVTGTKAVMERSNLRLDARSYRAVLDKLHLKLREDVLKCKWCRTHAVYKVYSIDDDLRFLFMQRAHKIQQIHILQFELLRVWRYSQPFIYTWELIERWHSITITLSQLHMPRKKKTKGVNQQLQQQTNISTGRRRPIKAIWAFISWETFLIDKCRCTI